MARKAAPGKDPDRPGRPLGRDERVSFYPMRPEDVLRKLLRTPPPRGGDESHDRADRLED
jgi:hypothetical protein